MSKVQVQYDTVTVPDHIEKTDAANAVAIAGSELRAAKTAVERRLLLKADFVILPMCALAWWVTYLDRNSIGNARIMGLEKDLHMTSDQFYNCLSMFFVGHTVFLLPANLTSRWIRPNRSVGFAMIAFGAVLCGIGAAKNYATVLVLRILLGCGQAYVQFLTGIEKRLSYESTGREPWSWLFIIEGVLAIAIGFIVFAVLPRFPYDLQKRARKHWLFTSEEIDLAAARFTSYNFARERIKAKQLLEVLRDPKSYLFAIAQGACVLGVSVVGSFLPSFIAGFGFSRVETQLFTVIPYACAFISVLICGYLSDRLNRKIPFLVAAFVLGCIGYILLLAVHTRPVSIFAACLITAILLTPVCVNINTVGFTKRGATWAFTEAFGLTWSIMGTRIYDTPPRYVKGHSVVLALNALACLCVITVCFHMRRINSKKELLEREYAERSETHPHIAQNKSLEEIGEGHISFRYVL
ncbi:uncharacterized protein A1O5_08630 [Cladophialophora psammophila CBS 110553]|uniref:Major facilitator superfamily (MFS) profile domain-containing protein n=1 Tax=Cladophialophora psammophila CBS 110553 TaxID=1182543 RepID=W9WSM5_9EURO|nr:uncharacterized protein A1O5_08630 [Cladophialophora psammophila CBS 110553]EXJ68015.1 hypothetical protein A1O5_08630 [Cladophialophora psammophila CBS 110553]